MAKKSKSKSKSKSKLSSKSKPRTSHKGLIAGLSIGGVVALIAGALVVLYLTGVLEKIFKKKPHRKPPVKPPAPPAPPAPPDKPKTQYWSCPGIDYSGKRQFYSSCRPSNTYTPFKDKQTCDATCMNKIIPGVPTPPTPKPATLNMNCTKNGFCSKIVDNCSDIDKDVDVCNNSIYNIGLPYEEDKGYTYNNCVIDDEYGLKPGYCIPNPENKWFTHKFDCTNCKK